MGQKKPRYVDEPPSMPHGFLSIQLISHLLQGFNPNMSERVQLLLSDRILAMTLVPEGRVWNYGIGLTQLWSPALSYAMILDTPLLFWAEEHRPAAFLTVSLAVLHLPPAILTISCVLSSLQILSKAKIVQMLKTVLLDCFGAMLYINTIVKSHPIK